MRLESRCVCVRAPWRCTTRRYGSARGDRAKHPYVTPARRTRTIAVDGRTRWPSPALLAYPFATVFLSLPWTLAPDRAAAEQEQRRPGTWFGQQRPGAADPRAREPASRCPLAGRGRAYRQEPAQIEHGSRRPGRIREPRLKCERAARGNGPTRRRARLDWAPVDGGHAVEIGKHSFLAGDSHANPGSLGSRSPDSDHRRL